MKHQFLVTVETQSGVAPKLVREEIKSHLDSLWSSTVQWVKSGKVFDVVERSPRDSSLVEVDFNTVLGMGGRGR